MDIGIARTRPPIMRFRAGVAWVSMLAAAPGLAHTPNLGDTRQAIEQQWGASTREDKLAVDRLHAVNRTYTNENYQVQVVFINKVAHGFSYTRSSPKGSRLPLGMDAVRDLLQKHRQGAEWRQINPADLGLQEAGGPHQSEMIKGGLQRLQWTRKDKKAVAAFDRVYEVFWVTTPRAEALILSLVRPEP